jgi:hypothetical protein
VLWILVIPKYLLAEGLSALRFGPICTLIHSSNAPVASGSRRIPVKALLTSINTRSDTP